MQITFPSYYQRFSKICTSQKILKSLEYVDTGTSLETIKLNANIKLTDQKRTFLEYITNRLTSRPISQHIEVLFFAQLHFLVFNFFAEAHLAHLFLLQPHKKPTQRQKQKSHFSQPSTLMIKEFLQVSNITLTYINKYLIIRI